jgi:microcystin-dependent protein
MAEPYIGEVRIVGFNFAPANYATCDGQIMPITQNTALFSILGTTYGGNGTSTFALPDLRGRIPVHVDIGNGFFLGQNGGEESITLNVTQLPQHNHIPVGSTSDPSASTGAGNLWARNNASPYAAASNVAMNSASVLPNGGSQPHPNLAPYLVVNFVIALFGAFPARN